REIPDLEFQIIGAGDGMDRITELVKELGLTEYVRFDPVVPVDQLPGILTQASVGVVPYLADAFTRFVLPTKLMEYAALGIPVITSRLPTIEAYFDEEMVAYFQSGNATELAEQIVRLFRDPGFAATLTANAAKFSERYNWPQQRAIYYEMVDALLKTKR